MVSLNKTTIAVETPTGSFPEAAFEADARECGRVLIERNSSTEEGDLIEALRNGDEEAFCSLVGRHYNSLLRMAMFYVPSRAVAEEVVQETWIGVLQGIGRFERRSSLRTWIFSILTHRAKTRGQQESRHISFSSLSSAECSASEQAMEPDRFLPADHAHWPHHWSLPPRSWGESPEKCLLAKETQGHLLEAIAALPSAQREVIRLRDIEQWTSREVCNVLGISETNQRVLLHRARSRVRRSLESYLLKGQA
jgi:RNA polymerase sigma-70 factor (ECF subfamily)